MCHQRLINLTTSGNLNVYNHITICKWPPRDCFRAARRRPVQCTYWTYSSSGQRPAADSIMYCTSTALFLAYRCGTSLISCNLIWYVTGLTGVTKLACSLGLPFSIHLRRTCAFKFSVNLSAKMWNWSVMLYPHSSASCKTRIHPLLKR
jgi:hypothetical protein